MSLSALFHIRTTICTFKPLTLVLQWNRCSWRTRRPHAGRSIPLHTMQDYMVVPATAITTSADAETASVGAETTAVGAETTAVGAETTAVGAETTSVGPDGSGPGSGLGPDGTGLRRLQ